MSCPEAEEKELSFYYSLDLKIGELNQVVHMWAFEDLNYRATQRQKFYTDPALATAFPKLRDITVKQESTILMPAPFSPLK